MEGIAVLRFDFTGLGDSKGDFADTNISSSVEDFIYASQFLESHYEAPNILIGHSLGGTIALIAAEHIKTSRAVAIINTPSEPAHLLLHFKGKREEIEEKDEAEMSIAGRTFRIKNNLLIILNNTI